MALFYGQFFSTSNLQSPHIRQEMHGQSVSAFSFAKSQLNPRAEEERERGEIGRGRGGEWIDCKDAIQANVELIEEEKETRQVSRRQGPRGEKRKQRERCSPLLSLESRQPFVRYTLNSQVTHLIA